MQNSQLIKTNLGAISASLYVSFQLISNVLSTKIALLPFVNLATDAGTLLYPLTFTLRDFVHKTLGKKRSRQIVVLAGLINLVMALLFLLVAKLTPDASWQFQDAFEKILLPVWRITLASVISQVVSELVDTEIFSWVYKKYSDVTAVLVSNTIALIVDSLVFSFLAFLGQLPLSVVFQIIVSNILIKFVMSVISSPVVKAVPRQVPVESI